MTDEAEALADAQETADLLLTLLADARHAGDPATALTAELLVAQLGQEVRQLLDRVGA